MLSINTNNYTLTTNTTKIKGLLYQCQLPDNVILDTGSMIVVEAVFGDTWLVDLLHCDV